MDNLNQSPEVETKTKTSEPNLKWNWFIGIFLLLTGLFSLLSNIIVGIFFLLAGLILLPPSVKKIKEKYGYSFFINFYSNIKSSDKDNSSNNICPHCRKEVDSKATRCPHCHGKIYIWTTGRKVLVGFIIFTVIVLVISSSSSKDDSSSLNNKISNSDNKTVLQNTISQEQAQKQLDEFMSLAKKAQVVTSYEFSDTASVVYVDYVWYTQTVQFKKDFLAKVGMLKKAITGYLHFEVRDAYSNEKVAEITAFSSSLEIYK
ncbi:MAG: hypothetical protein NTU76_02605 [Candidatus Taylorbacteria bacterium]|nr:hypothetical protein [Candidatus Taylorbacteria bacterium]